MRRASANQTLSFMSCEPIDATCSVLRRAIFSMPGTACTSCCALMAPALYALAARVSAWPAMVPPVAILFGAIAAAGGVVQRRMGLPDATVLVLQGMLFVVLLVSETFYGRFRIFAAPRTGDRV